MSDQEFQIAVIAIVFGSAVAVAFLITVGMIINSWIKRKSGNDLTDNDEFIEALRQFKQKTDRRLSNLETIVIDKSEPGKPKKEIKSSADRSKIEIDEKNEEDKQKNSGGNLKNMLKE